jgi:hypothetical protein
MAYDRLKGVMTKKRLYIADACAAFQKVLA